AGEHPPHQGRGGGEGAGGGGRACPEPAQRLQAGREHPGHLHLRPLTRAVGPARRTRRGPGPRTAGTGRVGRACAGGVVEGALYEIGVLCALEEAIAGLDTTRLDAYVGVSAGAIVAACLANGISPRAMSRAAIGEDESFGLRPEALFVPALREY